jgi:type II secretory pathway pseudopilin PulG
VEVLVAISAMGVLALVAVPRLASALARADVSAAREAFAASHTMARQVAVQYGRLSKFHLDPQRNSFWVTADTSSVPGLQVLDTIQEVVDVGERFGGVRLEARRQTFCFHPSGLATALGNCDLPNATVLFRRGSVVDTVTISRLGRLRKR